MSTSSTQIIEVVKTATIVQRQLVQSMRDVPRTVEVDVPGLPGIQGPPGTGAVPTLVVNAGETLFGGRAVTMIAGLAYLADPTNIASGAEIVGITQGAAAIGTPVTVQTSGPITDGAWNWSPGTVWVGFAGVLTQVLPTSGAGYAWLASIGVAASATQIVISPEFIAEF